MQVAKWGNSLAIRIPADVARALDLKEGDDVGVRSLSDGELAIVTERQRRAALVAQLLDLAVPFPADYRFDRNEANER